MNPTLSQLAAERCRASAIPLAPDELAAALVVLPGWQVDGQTLAKRFRFQTYREAIAFVNAVAWMAERADHHPEMDLGFAVVTVRYTTHSAATITRNDLICAARVESLLDA
ncbi:4a-hydroxytetrahydrobiopterin dehydratase [Burkholderiales bacterium]|nr:4a-hydroxytetrahydrobiopterin dehydratase [Burkholderiales bacterium]